MGITLTENAAKHVAAHLSKRGRGVGLRLAVRTSGCSGLAYKLEFADDVRPEDHRFESHGITVLVDPKSMPYLEGTELDFARDGLNEGFRFNNPNVKDECGCGESFNVWSRSSPPSRIGRQAERFRCVSAPGPHLSCKGRGPQE